MAIVPANWSHTVTVQDQQGDLSSMSFQSAATTHADAVLITQALVVALNQVTNAQVVRYSTCENAVEDAPAFPVGSEVQEKAVVSILLDGSLKYATLAIPAPASSLFVNSGVGKEGNNIDSASPDLVTFVNLFQSSASPAGLYLSDGEHAAATSPTQGGKRRFRSRRR